MTNFYGIFKCCWLKNTFKHTSWYALAIWLGTMNVANAGTGDETLPMSLDEAFNSGGVYILSSDIVIFLRRMLLPLIICFWLKMTAF